MYQVTTNSAGKWSFALATLADKPVSVVILLYSHSFTALPARNVNDLFFDGFHLNIPL
jgi:hypothetical protein